MAYGNWGAEIYCDGQPKHDNCDTTPEMVIRGDKAYGMGIWEHLLTTSEEERQRSIKRCYHAVVGDVNAGLLVCIYKSSPVLILELADDGQKEHQIENSPWDDDYEPREVEVTVANVQIELWAATEPERGGCKFTDKTGRIWKGVSGYCMGAGHSPWGNEL